jgi:hypothetical protein
MPAHDGCCRTAPFRPHFSQRAARRSMLLDASGPHRMMKGTNATGLRCMQYSQTIVRDAGLGALTRAVTEPPDRARRFPVTFKADASCDRLEDLDTSQEDHAADDWRLAYSSRPWRKPTPKKLAPIIKPRRPTFKELMDEHESR